MPQPILHLHLAERALARLGQDGRFVRAGERNAFLQGALGPDLGFFPGASPMLSKPVHHYRTAEMLRALVGNAESETERAYAWGWATHFLADALVHPLINKWCADQREHHGATETLIRLHVRIELGLDIQYIDKVDRQLVFPLRNCSDHKSIKFLRRAYKQTYGVKHDTELLLAATRNAARLAQRLHMLETLLAYDKRNRTVALAPHRLLLITLEGIVALAAGRDTVVSAFLSPITPPRQIAAEIADAIDQFEPWFSHCYETELAHLPNLDLDTAVPIPNDLEFAVA